MSRSWKVNFLRLKHWFKEHLLLGDENYDCIYDVVNVVHISRLGSCLWQEKNGCCRRKFHFKSKILLLPMRSEYISYDTGKLLLLSLFISFYFKPFTSVTSFCVVLSLPYILGQFLGLCK